MIVLRDVVEIGVAPEEVFDFLVHLDEHYRAWHPDHVSARWVTGAPGAEGSVLLVEERLHGATHHLKLRVTANRPNRELRYRIAVGVRGAFRIEPLAEGLRFIAELSFGWSTPVIGPLLDFLARHLLGARLEALRRHMEEEGVLLKALLESRGIRRLNAAPDAP